MSKAKLQSFLDRPQEKISEHLTHTPILLSDSKGFLLQREESDRTIVYWCESGATTRQLVSLLEARVLDANFLYKKIVFYIWAGTCDLTYKSGKFIYLRSQSDDIVERVCREYSRAVTICQHYGHTIKFIGLPNYSIQLYNKYKGHTDSLYFKEDDTILDKQILLLNSKIDDFNNSLNQCTVKFHCDLIKRRKDTSRKQQVRYSYNFSQLYDGLHANQLLNKVWLKKLYVDINKTCVQFPSEDIVDLQVPQSELDELN